MNKDRIKGVFLRYYYNLIKGPMQLTDLFYWPFVDILLWGLTSLWIQKQNNAPHLPLILMTGLIFWQVAWRGSQDIAVNLLQDVWQRNLVNLFSTPLKVTEWFAGCILLCLCKLLASIAFGSLVVYFLYSLNIFTLGWSFIPFAALLLMFGWTLGFFAAGVIIYWGHQAEMIAFMIAFVFAPFSAVFYPVTTLPEWAQMIAWSLPTTYVFEGMRKILLGDAFPLSFLWMSLTLNLVYLLLAILFFNWMFERSRKKGLGKME